MTGKDPKDMTASELLRRVVNDCNENITSVMSIVDQLRKTVGSKGTRTYGEDLAIALETVAGKIDAELAEAVRGIENPVEAVKRIIASGTDWPEPREGEGMKDWLERCWLPVPRYEGTGEIVSESDFGEDAVLSVYANGDWLINCADGPQIEGTRSQRVERPAPEVLLADGLPAKVGETVYQVDTGKGFEIARIAPMCPGDDMSKTLVLWGDDNEWRAAIDHTHTPPVLAADGLPLREGDTVWLTDEGARHTEESDTLAEAGPYALYGIGANDRLTVKALPSRFHPNRVDLMEECACCPASWLTHEEPDTQERIDEDAVRYLSDYWGCIEASCEGCPAKVDGMKPRERYGVSGCQEAMTLDLLRRQRELDARKGGE